MLRIAFVGQAVDRKGLPVLLRAFEALRDHVPATLTIVGAGPEDVTPVLADARGITALGKVDDATKVAVLRSSDVLCAPSLGGESFGMVLTEAFAAGTPVVASRIAGYQDVVRDGVDGVLVPRGDATALAEALRDLALAPERRATRWRVRPPATRSATRGRPWPPRSCRPTRTRSPSRRHGARPPGRARRGGAGRRPAQVPARRLPSLEPDPAGRSHARAALRCAASG